MGDPGEIDDVVTEAKILCSDLGVIKFLDVPLSVVERHQVRSVAFFQKVVHEGGAVETTTEDGNTVRV